MRRGLLRSIVLLVFAMGAMSAGAEEREPRFGAGVRYGVVTAGGEPANDMMGLGVYGRYRLNKRWRVGLAVDSASGDYEKPYEVLGVSASRVVDGTVDTVIFSGWIERVYGEPDGKLDWFWNVGLGYAAPDVDDVTGPTSSGGTFDIATDPGSETIVSASGGLCRSLAKRWTFEAALRVDHHLADWTLVDRDSSLTGTIDDYTAVGAHVGVAVRF